MATLPLKSASAKKVFYPESSLPVMESSINAEQRYDTTITLRDRLRGQDIYIWGDLGIYYQEGNPRAVVAPDVFAVRGVGTQPRRTYLVWVEGRFPEFILEITSSTTRRQDTGPKRSLYESLGVLEYFLYDPSGRLLRPALQGNRLRDGHYDALSLDAGGRLRSEVLGLGLGVHDGWLRVWDDAQGTWLPKAIDAPEVVRAVQAQAVQAQAQAVQAQAQAQTAEARTLELEDEVARLRALLEQRNGERR